MLIVVIERTIGIRVEGDTPDGDVWNGKEERLSNCVERKSSTSSDRCCGTIQREGEGVVRE